MHFTQIIEFQLKCAIDYLMQSVGISVDFVVCYLIEGNRKRFQLLQPMEFLYIFDIIITQ